MPDREKWNQHEELDHRAGLDRRKARPWGMSVFRWEGGNRRRMEVGYSNFI